MHRQNGVGFESQPKAKITPPPHPSPDDLLLELAVIRPKALFGEYGKRLNSDSRAREEPAKENVHGAVP